MILHPTTYFKNLCLSVGVLLLITLGAHGQKDASETSIFSPYVSAGLASSQVSGDGLSGFKQIGFSGGIGSRIDVNRRWQPRLEILYTQLGSRKNARPDQGDFTSYLLRLNYVQMPLLIGVDNDHLGFEAGLAPGYLVSSREDDQNGEIRGLSRDFNSYDLNLVIGIRYRFHERWELLTRLEQSIIPIRDHNGMATLYLNRGQYNSAVQFLLRFSVG